MNRIRTVRPLIVILALAIAIAVGGGFCFAVAQSETTGIPSREKAKEDLVSKTACNVKLVDRLLEVIEKDIVPITERLTKEGNKVFGAAILKKSDLSVVVAQSNHESENPLWHGEVYAIKTFYERTKPERPNPKDLIFLATHEPCSLCLSAITWAGYDNFFYLFSYQDTKQSFNIPYDLKIMKDVFKLDHGGFAQENSFWKSYNIIELINGCDGEAKQSFLARVDKLKKKYAEMSDAYQRSKGDSDIPFK